MASQWARFSLLLLAVLATRIYAITSGFYAADNGVDQTIVYQKISKKEKREMQQEILTVLGLDHRPKPHSHETDTSAPKYMLDLYRNLIDQDTGELRARANETALRERHLYHDEDSLHAIYDADIIMSFINHGKQRRVRKCRRLQPLKVHQKQLQSSRQTERACNKSRNATNRRKAAHEKVHLRHDKDRRFWFDMSEVPVGEMLLGAELRLYKEHRPHRTYTNDGTARREPHSADLPHDSNYTLSIYEIVKGSHEEDRELHVVDSTNVTLDYEGWVYLNISAPVSKWLVFPEYNLGIYLRIHADGKDHEILPREISLVGIRGRHEYQPFVVAFFKTPVELHVRRTRATKQRQRTDISYNDAGWNAQAGYDMERIQKRGCQKRTLYVSFKELGWQDWIIAPDGYAAFYCQGECSFPLNAHMNATNHAIVQTLVHLMNPSEVPKPCCAPTKLTAISVLYFDDNSNVILKKYRNMVVKSCGCH